MIHRVFVFILLLATALGAQQECVAYGPLAFNGSYGNTIVQPGASISGTCPNQGCYFLFHLEVSIGPIPNTNPPTMPVPEPPIHMDVFHNGDPIVSVDVTTPPSNYDWELDVQGPIPCDSEVQVEFTYDSNKSLGYVVWGCGGC